MITKREYLKALNIVDAYENQFKKPPSSDKSFGFLWFDFEDKDHCRYIKAKNIDSACKKFLKKLPKTILKIDYEVSFGDYFIDISKKVEFKEYL